MLFLLQKLTKEVQTTLAEANRVAEETISGMRTVRSFANESGEANSYYAKLLVMFELNKKEALAYACYMWSSSVGIRSCLLRRRCLALNQFLKNESITVLVCFFFQISELALEVAVLYYGGHLVITGQMSSGHLISFFIYMLELGECLEVCHFFLLQVYDNSSMLPTIPPITNALCLAEHCIGVYGPHAGSGSRGEDFRVPGQETQTSG